MHMFASVLRKMAAGGVVLALLLMTAGPASARRVSTSSWTAEGGPYGGLQIGSVAVAPNDPDVVYAGASNGVWRSDDAAASWKWMGDGLPDGMTSTVCCTGVTNVAGFTVVVDPTDAKRVYAIQNNPTSDCCVFRSRDGGATWSSTDLGGVAALAVVPSHPRILYALDPNGNLHRSLNHGSTWTVRSTLPWGGGVIFHPDALVLDPQRPWVMWATNAIAGGVVRSDDRGKTWTDMHLAADHLAVDPVNPSIVYGVVQVNGTNGVYRSRDDGRHWKLTDGPFPTVSMIAVDPAAHRTIYVSTEGGGVDKSTDSGNSFSVFSGGLPGADVTWLSPDPSDRKVVYAGTEENGVAKTATAFSDWQPADTGLQPIVQSLAAAPSDAGTLYAGSYFYRFTAGNDGSVVFATHDGGALWHEGHAVGVGSHSIGVSPTDSNTLYVGTSPGVATSTDGGVTWTPAPSGYPDGITNAVAVDPQNGDVYETNDYTGCYISRHAYESTVYRSTDQGATWQPQGPDGCGNVPTAIVVDPSDSNRVYSARFTGIYRTTDGGANWGDVGPGNMAALAVSPSDPSIVYAAGMPGVSKSTDHGDTWSSVTNELSGQIIDAIAVDPSDPSTAYAGTLGGGIFKTTNGGASWSAFNTGLGSLNVFSLTIAGGILHAGTMLGVWERALL